MIYTGKVIDILDLIKIINESTKYIPSGKVTIYIDSKKVLLEYGK